MAAASVTSQPIVTPDGRYIVVRGRLWRRANPNLAGDVRQALVARLMAARRDVGRALKADDQPGLAAARAEVDQAKVGLGERGPTWWQDSDEDLNRHQVKNTAYADWFANLPLTA